MEENKQKNTGKRVKKGGGGKWIVPVIVVVCLLAAAAAGYAVLCNRVTDRVLPNSTAQGLDVGGLTREEAEAKLNAVTAAYDAVNIDLVYGDTVIVFEAAKADPSFNVKATLDDVVCDGPFLSRGITWLKALSGEHRSGEYPMMFAEPVYIDGLITDLNATLSNPVVQHYFTQVDGKIKIVHGKAGQAIFTEGLEETLLAKVLSGDSTPLILEGAVTQPAAPDFQAVYDLTYVEPVNASLNVETMEIIPHVEGVSVDLEAIMARFEATAPGESFFVDYIYTEPEITTEILTENLFAHKLGDGYSQITGTSARVSNVTLAGSFCHETILLPGEVFSYWSKIEPCTEEQGFKPAPTYVNGATVPGIGGGICQVSSTIYTACLEANLEIVERRPHSYIPNYLPNGSDAMVNGSGSDFKFKNNTNCPIQIRVYVSGRNLTVELWGSKFDDTYVVMEHVNLTKNPYTTVYKFDTSIPVGSLKEDVSGYDGYRTVSYRNIYAGDGTLISRTKEGNSNYLRRDRVVRINPADASKYNLNPITGEPLPEASPAPTTEVLVTPTPPVETTSAEETAPPADPDPTVSNTETEGAA